MAHPLQKTMSRARSRRIVLPPVQEHIYKIEEVIEEGDYYGAQQMYKTVGARYLAAEKYSEALDILQSGACTQLKLKQVTCGAELAVLFVETLVKGQFPYDDDTLDRVRKIYKNFPQIPLPLQLGEDDDVQQLSEALGAAKTRVEGCSSFLKAALKWSMEFGSHRNGSPEIHVMLATYIYSESPEVDMAKVSYHFVRGNNPKEFASILVNFMGKCYPGEDDMAIARAVLMYLSLGNLRDANHIIDELKKREESEGLEFPDSELMEFIMYLLLTLQRDALPLFNMLRANYKPSIEREPALNEFLDEIGEKFYGVRRRNPLQGIFGDFLKMMG
ncbi:Golgi to ER traffic protein 4 homolog [Momordica charantia]|uniref:Golgi to ER traffic protein 4 homolog n=1 Tax=Momordica charantia TaxID=3673 RepID=A0A6J1DQY0_MOMCH|nr:Golgi to ER traffic protein 4 homolog [Momordica charantia]